MGETKCDPKRGFLIIRQNKKAPKFLLGLFCDPAGINIVNLNVSISVICVVNFTLGETQVKNLPLNPVKDPFY
jgi:hypothetical protein